MRDKELHEEFQLCGANAKKWIRKCQAMLPEIERRRIWEKKGFGSIYEYAFKLAKMSKHQVREALRVMKKIEDKPALLRVAKEKGVNAVRPVATIATQENQAELAKYAESMSKHTLETFARDYQKSHPGESITEEKVEQKPNLQNFTFKISSKNLQKLKSLKGEKTWDEFIKNFIHLIEDEQDKLDAIEKDAIKMRKRHFQQTAPEPKEQATRHIPKKIKTHIQARSQNTCEHPNCKKLATEIHHIDPFAIHKTHDTNQMQHLCKAHHQLTHKTDELVIKYRQQARAG